MVNDGDTILYEIIEPKTAAFIFQIEMAALRVNLSHPGGLLLLQKADTGAIEPQISIALLRGTQKSSHDLPKA